MAEKQPTEQKKQVRDLDKEDLFEETREQQEAIRAKIDASEKRRSEKRSEEEVLNDATELAKEADEEKIKQEQPRAAEKLRRAPSKKQRNESFDAQMKDVRSEMRPGDRIMSMFIHNAVIEKVSDVVASTIARPNAMLSGSIAAFIAITLLYFIARYYGYRLSGFETVSAFTLGWIAGIVYDYVITAFRSRNR